MNDIIIHEIFSGITSLVLGATVIICFTWIVITIVKSLKQRANVQTKTELYSRMIDKFGTAPEFIAFLQSEEGRAFIEENVTQSAWPMNKILFSIQIGVISTLLGIGLLTLCNIFDSNLGGDLYIVLAVSGTVAIMIGIGLLISTVISYKLSKAWGILPGKEKEQTN